jgi:carbon-monoxide dehydrogenase small subunit
MAETTTTDAPVGHNEHYVLHVNGQAHDVMDAWVGESLLYVLRERLGLTGSKGACEQGECGSCSVLVDGELVCSCLVMAASAIGQPIVTIEGIAAVGAPSDVQAAFVEAGAVQCGFCTPGLIMATHALLDRSAEPSELEIREELSGNVCRCTGYGRIVEAVQRVAIARNGGAA